MKKTIFYVFTLVTIIFSCTKDQAENPNLEICESTSISFSNNVIPIFEAKCSFPGCHSTNAPIGDFTTHESMTIYIENSQIENRALTATPTMPPTNFEPFTVCEVEQIKSWIADGYPEN